MRATEMIANAKIAWAVLLFALAVRTTSIMFGSSSLRDDTDAYARIAVTWAKTGTMGYEAEIGSPPNPTAYRPPLYPWILSWLVYDDQLFLPAVGALHIAMGMATVLLTARIGLLLGMDKAAWWAAAGVAIDPLLLRAGQQVMTETLATLLSVASMYAFAMIYSARRADFHYPASHTVATRYLLLRIVLGGALGLAILARPTAAPWALWVLAILVICQPADQNRWKGAMLVATVTAAMLAPWTMRNLAQFGKPVWSTTHGGYTFLLANNPLLYNHFRSSGPSRDWDANDFHAHWEALALGAQSSAKFWDEPVQALPEPIYFTEVESDKIAYRAALETIALEPGTFVISCGYRILWLWHLFPNHNSGYMNTCIGLWYMLVFSNAVFGTIYVLQQGRNQTGAINIATWAVAIGLAISLTLVHALFWSNMRMRSPVMPVVYLLSLARFGRSHCC